MAQKFAALVVLVLLAGVVGAQISIFVRRERDLSRDVAELEARFSKAQSDNEALERELEYLAQPVNLEKELRARFNFRHPDEEMLIIVPPRATSSSATSSD